MKWMTLRSESETVFVDSSSMSGLHATGRFGGRVDGGMRATPSRYPRSSGSASLVAALLGPIREIFPISLFGIDFPPVAVPRSSPRARESHLSHDSGVSRLPGPGPGPAVYQPSSCMSTFVTRLMCDARALRLTPATQVRSRARFLVAPLSILRVRARPPLSRARSLNAEVSQNENLRDAAPP